MFKSNILPLTLSLLFLIGCAVTPAHMHYINCEATHSPFEDIASCGKESRQAYCEEYDECSTVGNILVSTIDELKKMVRNNEISESEAKIRYLELIGTYEKDRNRAIAAALRNISKNRPKTCYTSGSTSGNSLNATTTCY